MLTRLSIRLSPDATLAMLQEISRQQHQMQWFGQPMRRGRNIVIDVHSNGARPVNLFCRRLIEAELAETVTVQRLDA